MTPLMIFLGVYLLIGSLYAGYLASMLWHLRPIDRVSWSFCVACGWPLLLILVLSNYLGDLWVSRRERRGD